MYYRVAIQTSSSPVLKWKSTVLSSLDVLFRFLKLHHTIPANRLHIFTSSSREDMNEMLLHENNGLATHSVTAEQFLLERHLHVWETGIAEQTTQGTQTTTEEKADVSRQPALLTSRITTNYALASSIDPLDRRRQEIESGTAGDHDCPYIFTLPQSVPEMLAWMMLHEKVQFSLITLR
ncbi:MAG TPA: hypothetical protein VNG51_06700 [Ktedonobacteraceae bacterium]|nr:hypothetical protein [Ktedonobacteraceae bacterium]